MGKIRRFDFNISIETPDVPDVGTLVTTENSPSGSTLLSVGDREKKITFNTAQSDTNYSAQAILRDENDRGEDRDYVHVTVKEKTTTYVIFKFSSDIINASTYLDWSVYRHD